MRCEFNVLSGRGSLQRIQQSSYHRTVQKRSYLLQNHNHRRTKRIHCMKQLKRSVTAYLSFTNAAYISKQEIAHQSTVVDSTNLTKSIEPISDDDSTNERHGREALDLWLYNRATTVHPIAAENTNQNSSMDYKLWYDSTSAKIPNISTYMENFCNMEFDNWGRTYNEMKDGMYSWKSHYFKDLKSNDSIYESACGIGMNLYMTLEILQQFGITNITISGNDFVPKSVQIAQEIYSRTVNGTPRHVLPSSFGQLGGIYEADSTQLDFIPSNSFDLVYTGYISPLNKPLDSTIDVSQPLVLAKRAQQLQDDWYGKWVGEMIRIAKPGVPIIVEQVSYPRCEAKFDWGGVAPTFWKDAIKRYNWDVNSSSIETAADTIFRKRYHVFMRKNGRR